jgi:hypothetical protein
MYRVDLALAGRHITGRSRRKNRDRSKRRLSVQCRDAGDAGQETLGAGAELYSITDVSSATPRRDRSIFDTT